MQQGVERLCGVFASMHASLPEMHTPGRSVVHVAGLLPYIDLSCIESPVGAKSRGACGFHSNETLLSEGSAALNE
jgi:hypothetical protein